jgi:hypothetical protein
MRTEAVKEESASFLKKEAKTFDCCGVVEWGFN